MTATAQATVQQVNEPGAPGADRDAIVAQYMPLVRYVVQRTAGSGIVGLEREDLVSYGTIGLLEAIDRFDPERGYKFSSFALLRIRGAIIDAIRALDPLGRRLRGRSRQLDHLRSELGQELGEEPSEAQLAEAAGLTTGQVRETTAAMGWSKVSLDTPVSSDEPGGATLESITPDPGAIDFIAAVEHRELLAALTRAVKRLPPRELLLVSLRYQEGLSFDEIGRVLEVSASRVSQLHARALSRLRMGHDLALAA